MCSRCLRLLRATVSPNSNGMLNRGVRGALRSS
jgi:hypothetical protein